MGNQVCCTSREKRQNLLKKRDAGELEYEKHMLEERRAVGILCSISSTTGASVAVAAAVAAPETAGGSIAAAAIFAVGSAIQACVMHYVDETKLADVTSELRRRRVRD